MTSLRARRIVSTHIPANQRLTTGLLDKLPGNGAEGIELFCARQSFDWRQPAHVEAVAGWFRQSKVQLHAVHSPIFTDEAWGRGGDPPVDISHPDGGGGCRRWRKWSGSLPSRT